MTSLYQSQRFSSVYPFHFIFNEMNFNEILSFRKKKKKNRLVIFKSLFCRYSSCCSNQTWFSYFAYACIYVCVHIRVAFFSFLFFFIVVFLCHHFFFFFSLSLVCLFSRAYRQGYIHYVLMNDEREKREKPG